MSRSILLIGSDRALRDRLAAAWGSSLWVREGGAGGSVGTFLEERLDEPCAAIVWLAEPPDRQGRFAAPLPAPPAAAHSCLRVLVSSTEIYAPDPHHPGRASEEQLVARRGATRIAEAWAALEEAARAAAAVDGAPLTILRCPWIALASSQRCGPFDGRTTLTLPGHDPSVQVLSPDDLAAAIVAVVEGRREGTFNLAPRAPIPLRRGLAISGGLRIPLPLLVQRLLGRSPDRLSYRRYSWTVSGERAAVELGLRSATSSGEALLADRRRRGRGASARLERQASAEWDDWGRDCIYIARFRRTLFRFLHDVYWRVDPRGLEHIPREGPAILVGVHRGFMPWDGVMAMHQIARHTGRLARFLIHPGLIKFPFLADYMTRLGGVVAARENADELLGRGELLGVFPEGIYGAFSLYREAYQLKKMGRDEYVKLALRHQVPLVPFVTVGSAEIFPIFRRYAWGFWIRATEWPFFPITPTFPLLPVPLPSKWHTRYLEPIGLDDQPPEAADDPAVVRALGQRVEAVLQAALDDLRSRRRHIFWGALEAG